MANKASLTPSLFIELPVPSYKTEWSYIHVCVSSFYELSIEYWSCSDCVVCLAFHFVSQNVISVSMES